MHILVDADACPVKQVIERTAKELSIPVTMYIDTSHVLHSDYSQIITVSQSADAVDFALMTAVKSGDIVVTQDYGVAAMALSKGAYAIHQSGKLYTNENIDLMLFERHLSAKNRRGGKHSKGPSKRTREDDLQFESAFRKLCMRIL